MLELPSISETTLGLTFFVCSSVAHVCRRSWKRVVSGSFALEKRLELARGDIAAAVEGRAELTRGVARAPLPLGTTVAEPG
jgi:hypothetical protein